MRGLNYVTNHYVENHAFNMQKGFMENTYNWNPVHFAIFYKKVNILELFYNLYQSKFNMIWASKMEETEPAGGIGSKRLKQGIHPQIHDIIL